jgi:penicillin-binding protein 2
MLIFDQLKKSDPQLRVLTLVVLVGLVVLLGGLWWVQIVSSREYQANLETQSFRTVRIPAVRGKILDRNGAVLAENRAMYSVGLYLDELRNEFRTAYSNDARGLTAAFRASVAEREKNLGRGLTKEERRKALGEFGRQKIQLQQQARYNVASNVVAQVGQCLRLPLSLDRGVFERHYQKSLALPYLVVTNLDGNQIALFEEKTTSPVGVDLDLQSMRYYPNGAAAAHVLGQLKQDNSSRENEDAYFSFRLPDYVGRVGVEYALDEQLRGMAGAKSVLVNSIGYRQTENIWSDARPGENVHLTLDLGVQQAAERALATANGPNTKGAAVVMDVQTGDILAMASAPAYDPNWFVPNLSNEELKQITEAQSEKNRATQENYMPGSIFKLVVGMAALEAGWDPNKLVEVPSNPAIPQKGHIVIRGHKFKDTADAGMYDFKLAIKRSSNTYFIKCATNIGPARILRLGHLLHLGERTGFAKTRQEVGGNFPTQRQLDSGWNDINTGNVAIGQDPVWVTPLQMAVMVSAIANGGKVLQPRLIDRVESADPFSGVPPEVKPSGVVRERLGVSQRTMAILHDAMLAETEDSDGTGKNIRKYVPLTGLRVCGKTGTAQVQNERSEVTGHTVWMVSFAPYCPPGSNEKPKYAVVVMVEKGVSGGVTCAPVVGKIYQALLDRDQTNRAVGPLARGN